MSAGNFELIIDTTNMCFMHCRYCGTNSSTDAKQFLPADSIISAVDTIATEFASPTVFLGGGSFYCHPDHDKILKVVTHKNAIIKIDLPLHEATIRFLEKYPPSIFNYTVSLSLWGIGAIHDTLSGKETFANFSKLAELVRCNQPELNLSFVLTNELIAQKDELKRFLIAHCDQSNIYFHRLMPSGRCSYADLPSPVAIKTFADDLRNSRLPCKIRFHHTIYSNKCVAFCNRLFINYTGNVYGCGWIKADTIPIGNILHDNLKTICTAVRPNKKIDAQTCNMLFNK